MINKEQEKFVGKINGAMYFKKPENKPIVGIMRKVTGLLLLAAISALATYAQEEKVDVSVVERINQEALQNSQVMEQAFFLSDVYGSRFTGSPGFQAAGNWAVKRLQDFAAILG